MKKNIVFLWNLPLIGYLGIDRDVTARKLSEMALQKAHDELQEKTIRLEVKKNSLEEINTAMKILLKKREEDKTEIESNVLTNVKELIEPYVEKIKKTKLDDQQRALFSIMESNINEIVSISSENVPEKLKSALKLSYTTLLSGKVFQKNA